MCVKLKLVASAVLALVVTTMMVSTVNAQTSPAQAVLIELEEAVQAAPNELFQGYTVTYTRQQKDALIQKIEVVIAMMEKGENRAAITKLENDIARKLTICDTQRVRARSWLSTTPDDEEVRIFSRRCLDLINDAITLASQQ